ncbi:hypothetical protein J19TS1_35630 [Heyndrickxia oleronia]|nr:hypothetical protein J19TS1_35630 [Heyndrickxia oleronia]
MNVIYLIKHNKEFSNAMECAKNAERLMTPTRYPLARRYWKDEDYYMAVETPLAWHKLIELFKIK